MYKSPKKRIDEVKGVKKSTFKDILIINIMIILGCGIYGFGLNYFIVANNLASGGFSGVGLILNYQFGWSIGAFFLISNVPILIISGILWGRSFVWKTLVGVVASSFFADFFSFVSFKEENLLLPAIYGGLLMGVGLGIVMRFGGTTGGTDILARMANQYKGISISGFLISFNIIVLTAVAVIYGLDIALYSMVNTYISSIVLDRVVNGLDSGKQVFIVSVKNEEISKYIIEEMHRGCTLLQGEGAYSHRNMKIIMCVVNRWQIFKLRKGIMNIDPKAFIVISNAYEIYGKGFKQ